MGFKHALQKNDKGQLRLSHRALLPDTDPDNSNSNVKQTESTDGLVEMKTEQPKDKFNNSKGTASSKRSSEDGSVLPSKKFIRRMVSPSQEKPVTNKDKTKKSSNKEVNSASSKDESSLVSGEA